MNIWVVEYLFPFLLYLLSSIIIEVEYNEKCQGISEHECKTVNAVCDKTTEICKCGDTQFLDGDTCSDSGYTFLI